MAHSRSVRRQRLTPARSRDVAGRLRNESAKAQENPLPSRRLFQSIQDIAAVLALTTVLAYGIAYYLQYSFYREFRLTPDQVGVDRLSALLRIAPLIVTVAGVTAVLGLTILRVGSDLLGIIAVIWRVHRRHPWRVRTIYFFVLVLLWWAAGEFLDGSSFFGYGAKLAIGVLAFFLAVMLMDWNDWPWLHRRHVVVGSILALIAAGSVSLGNWIADGAKDLAASGNYARRFGAIGIPVDYAAVRWIDPIRKPASIVEQSASDPVKPPRLLVILNQSATTYAFYDCRTGQSHVIPVTDVVIERVREPRGLDRSDWLRKGTGCDQRR